MNTLARENFTVVIPQDRFPVVPVGEEQPVKVTLINYSETQEDTMLQVG